MAVSLGLLGFLVSDAIYHGVIYSKKSETSAANARPHLLAEALDDDRYEALAGFRYALRAFLAFSEAANRSAGITTQQYQALLAIRASHTESLLVGELANELLIRHNAAVQLADRLVASGHIRRVTSQHDRRAVGLQLTAKGARCIASLAAAHYRELTQRHSELGDILNRGKRLRPL